MSASRRIGTLLAAIALLGLLPVFGVPGFYSASNLRNMAMDCLPTLVAACGMTVVIVTAEIDISIGSLFVACGAVAGLAAKAGCPMPVVALLTLACGASLGLVNGLLVGVAQIPSIIATLATLAIVRNTLLRVTQGSWIQDLPQTFQWFGLEQGTAQAVYPLASLVILACSLFALARTSPGRSFYAVGCSHEASRRIGINPRTVVIGAFTLMGVATALASLLNFTRYPAIETTAGLGFELQVIAAVVVGGTAITGGRGTIAGTFLGVVLLGMIGTVFTFLHVNPAWLKAIQGCIILIAVVSDTAFSKEARRG